ncbi:sensor histidine kinase [Priestia taiwanensis]|uniref:histidine kinase n=1 Tax=Priestia taiwanensis TaxID=1347902 RepID=A0A917ERC4_9BACI|nr:histidine kinase [Priestia taiwanensis]MBM7363882.1 two-component system nitrate/nitrite sensor histidine kinase NarQ [Priestia taiwanensis]GGE69772.1 hypothetical protein GCM10007140_19750 [Priestia taiwanensis]
MTDKQIKALILLIPPFAIGMWEYVRHEFLLPYLSMDLGNVLSPFIVFFVTVFPLLKLFRHMERSQEELKQERALKSSLEERENIARELHDGIAQSLFLLSVKMNKLKKELNLQDHEHYQKMVQTLQHVHEDVRQSIKNLRETPSPQPFSLISSLQEFIDKVKYESDITVHFDWTIQEELISPKEKVTLFACIKEAITNAMKHANCKQLWIQSVKTEHGWQCIVQDDGVGFPMHTPQKGYGLEIMKDRTAKMNWNLYIKQANAGTIVQVEKVG